MSLSLFPCLTCIYFTSLKTVKLFSNNRVYSPDNWCSLQQWSSGLVETKLVLSELKQNGAAIGLSGLRGNSRGGECQNFIIQSPVPGDTPPQNTVRKNKIRMIHLLLNFNDKNHNIAMLILCNKWHLNI